MTNRLHQLATFVTDVPATAVPAAATVRARQALVDFCGVAIAGTSEPVSQLMTRFVGRSAGVGKSTMIGTDLSAGALDAALANATTGHALDFDDSSFVLGGHPSVTLWPALLALAEQNGATGRQLLDAYAVGFEVLIRMARIVNFHHYEKGWHPTATLGTFGVAAAAGRLLSLTAAQNANALGLAASFASGIKQSFGTMAKPIQVGHAAQKGLMAALLAAEGATASLQALEGKQGFFAVYDGLENVAASPIEGLGESWELVESGLMFKKYACCGSTHPVIDAAIELALRDDLKPEDVETIGAAINPRRIPHVNRPVVADALAAKFSLQYTAAAALADRALGLRHFSEAVVGRVDLQRLLARVEVSGLDHVDSDLSQACELTVKTTDGTLHAIRLEEANGRRADDYEQFKRAKFMDCAGEMLASVDAERLLDRLENFDAENDVRSVMRMMTPPPAAARTEETWVTCST